MLRLAIPPVGDQREREIIVRVGKMVIFQPFDLLFDRRSARKQNRHDNDRAKIRRDAVAQFQSGQDRSADQFGDRAVYERDCNIRSRNQAYDRQNKKRPGGDSQRCDGDKYERENDRGDHRDHAHIARHAQIGIELKEPGPQRHPASQFLLERAAALGDQVISWIAFAPSRGHFSAVLVRRASGGRYRAPCHVHFVAVRFAREFLDRAPVTVACRKIHRREIAGAAQYRVDRTDAFEEFSPIDHRDQAHAHDDIANASRPLRSGAGTPRARSDRWSCVPPPACRSASAVPA